MKKFTELSKEQVEEVCKNALKNENPKFES